MTTDRIRGGLAPVATPFAADLRPDTERLHRHCRRLLSNGAGIVFFTNVAPGTTGVAVAGASGRNTCSIFGTSASSWPVEAKTTTYVFATCR